MHDRFLLGRPSCRINAAFRNELERRIYAAAKNSVLRPPFAFSRTPVLRRRPSWHVNCGHSFRNKSMAAKMRMLKLLQEIRGFAELSNRRPHPRSPGLFFTHIRSHLLQGVPPRRRLSIRIDTQDLGGGFRARDFRHPVDRRKLRPQLGVLLVLVR